MHTRQLDTQSRLIEAAGEVFSEKGFRQASVREICRRAGLSGPALINYHFRDKQGLYREVLRYSFTKAREQFGADAQVAAPGSAEDRLFAYVHMQLRRTKLPGRPSWLDKLMAREMFEPTGLLDEVVRETILPSSMALRSIVQELLGGEASDAEAAYCCLSIVGQCLHHHFARRIIPILYPFLSYGPDDLERLARHITRFSLAGLEAARAAGGAAHEQGKTTGVKA